MAIAILPDLKKNQYQTKKVNKPRKRGDLVSTPQTQIAPVYQNAISQTASHYQTMVAFVSAQMVKIFIIDHLTLIIDLIAGLKPQCSMSKCLMFNEKSSCGASAFFTQDIEEIGGVK